MCTSIGINAPRVKEIFDPLSKWSLDVGMSLQHKAQAEARDRSCILAQPRHAISPFFQNNHFSEASTDDVTNLIWQEMLHRPGRDL